MKVLFDRFPRAVGCPEQHIVHSEGEFDVFVEAARGHRNAYSSVSWFPVEEDRPVVVDKVSYDFDAPDKESAFPAGFTDHEKVAMMRGDPDVAKEVLMPVCEDVSELVIQSQDDGIPVVGVFSGFGIHVHQLFQPVRDAKQRMATVARRYQDVCDLQTMDPAIVGDHQRILRVPNMKRVHHDSDSPPYEVAVDCGLWTVPLTGREMRQITPEDLLGLSTSARPDALSEPSERPEMPLYDDYAVADDETFTAPPREVTVDYTEVSDEFLAWHLEGALRMPCMVQRALQTGGSPAHKVRLNTAVLLFNLGRTPTEVADIFERIGWQNFDRQTTEKQLDQIYSHGYSSMSCSTLRRIGLCVHADDPESCPTFGWRGGEKIW